MTAAAERRLREMYEEHGRRVLAYFTRRTDSESARDGAAEVFLIAWRRIDDVPPGDAAIRWLYATARRVLANQRRTRARQGRLVYRLKTSTGNPEPGPETVVVRREQDRLVMEALDHLAPDDREILRLTVWEELPRDEVAAMLGCSRHAANQRVHRASRRLATELHHLDTRAPTHGTTGGAP